MGSTLSTLSDAAGPVLVVRTGRENKTKSGLTTISFFYSPRFLCSTIQRSDQLFLFIAVLEQNGIRTGKRAWQVQELAMRLETPALNSLDSHD